MNSYPMGRKDNLVVQEIDGEVLIYDLTENKAFCLNETSALVWQACDGTKSAAEISQFISQKLNLPANEDLVWFALDQLKKEKLIENSEEIPNHFAGVSRREVIKKIGLGSMVALPIVASMIAPTAVHAQSTCVPLGSPTGVCTCQEACGDAGMGAGQPCTPAATTCIGGCTCKFVCAMNGDKAGICS